MAAPLQPIGGALAFRVVVLSDEEPRDAGRWSEGAEASGRERGSGDGVRKSRHQGEYGLDALAYKNRTGEGSTEMDGTAVDVPECFAWALDGHFGGPKRVEPGAVDAGDIAVSAGYGGDKGRKTANAGAIPVEQGGVEAERWKTAMVNLPGPEIGLGVGAGYGTATPPKAGALLPSGCRFRDYRGWGLAAWRGSHGPPQGWREASPSRRQCGSDRGDLRARRWRHRSTFRERPEAIGGRRASAPWRREGRRRSSIGLACGRGGGIAGRPLRRAREARRRRRRPHS